MFYISKDYGDGTYSITDSNDNAEERYDLETIKQYKSQGTDIKGVSLKSDNINVYPTFEDYCRKEIARLKLLGLGTGFEFSGDYKSFINTDNRVTDAVIPDFISRVGRNAFRYCKVLKSITIPNSVTTIDGFAFEGCESLKAVTIPNSVTEIGWDVFRGCKKLKAVTIPDSVTEIGEGVFRDCKNLKSITIPDSVTEIGKDAFRDCKNLKSITIPDSVTEIGRGAFYGCISLDFIEIPDSVTYIGYRTFCKQYIGSMDKTVDIKVKCNRGSYAEKYCKEHRMEYEVI